MEKCVRVQHIENLKQSPDKAQSQGNLSRFYRVFTEVFSFAIIMTFIGILFVLLVVGEGRAEQTKYMRGDDVANVVISQTESSRIKLINDRIQNIRVNNGELFISQDSKQGDAYIRTTNTYKKNINIFITSEKGFVYQLMLTTKNIPTQQIFIKNSRVYSKGKDGKQIVSDYNISYTSINFKDNYKQGIINLIKSMSHRDNVEGFDIIDRSGSSTKFKKKYKLKLSWETSYLSNNLVGEIFTVKNIGKKPITIDEEIFLKRGLLAVKLDSLTLNPDEVTSLYLVGGRSDDR